MNIFVINLDCRPMRWQRMANLLRGCSFQRIPAVDGRRIDGPELRDRSRPLCFETLSRYERACVLSHRLAWHEFLSTGLRFACVLEDDVFLSPDFARFINNEDWLPPDCSVMKLETCFQEVSLSRKTLGCLDRRAALPRSLHFGSAAYIVSRPGARRLLAATSRPDRPIDRMMFDTSGLKTFHPVYQLFPALCIQASHQPGGITFPELESSIQPISPPKPGREIPAGRKTLSNKIKREVFRPFLQLKRGLYAAGILGWQRLQGIQHGTVPFA